MYFSLLFPRKDFINKNKNEKQSVLCCLQTDMKRQYANLIMVYLEPLLCFNKKETTLCKQTLFRA